MAYLRECRRCKQDIHSLWEVRYGTKYEVIDYYHYHCQDYMKRHRIPLDRTKKKTV